MENALKSEHYTTHYKQITSRTMRSALRHGFLSTMGSFYKLVGRMSQALKRNRVQILLLHHIFEDEEDSFRALLTELVQDHSFVSYSKAIELITFGNIDHPYISITFDDGFKNCLQAAKILDEFGMKACFFVCPSIIGETNYSVIKRFCRERLLMAPTKFMTWNDIDRLLCAGHEIGGHTLTHPILSQLPDVEVRYEVKGSFETLKRRVGVARHFAWPYGRFFEFSPLTARTVFSTGFETCASAVRGCHIGLSVGHARELCIRRDEIIAKWPLSHSLYFLTRNSLTASEEGSQWPEAWREEIQNEQSLT